MKFEIIKNSQSETGYKIEDNTYYGIVPGLDCGWQFEIIDNNDGKLHYMSVMWDAATPEDVYKSRPWAFEFMTFSGRDYKLTGRVIFRGYGEPYWYAEERDWCIKPISDEKAKEILEFGTDVEEFDEDEY